MKELIRLRIRPSRDGRKFAYVLDYVDTEGKRRRVSLGHADKRKAESVIAQKERELRMGVLGPSPMKLSEFLEDSLARTGDQTRESTVKCSGKLDWTEVIVRQRCQKNSGH